MPNRRVLRGGPSAQVPEGCFPHGALDESVSAPVRWAAEIARRLESALAQRNMSDVATNAGVGRQTMYDILRGTTWPDLVTIVHLQEHLKVALLPEWEPGASETRRTTSADPGAAT